MFTKVLIDRHYDNLAGMYGILICENDTVTPQMIQDKIDEITSERTDDWWVGDIVDELPLEWNITLQDLSFPLDSPIYI